MIYLTSEEIITLHKRITDATGGDCTIKDKRLLESAIFSAIATFDNEEIYKTIAEKSARLAFSIIKNHAFVDGNKRIGIIVMLITLKLNKYNINYTQNELVTLGLGIADGSFRYEKILKWILDHHK